MQDKPAVGLYHDTRRPVAGGKFPVKVRVTFEVYVSGKPTYVPKYFHTKCYLSKEQFETVLKGTARGVLREQQDTIYAARAKAAAIVERDERINIDQFLLVYEGKVSVDGKVSDMFDEIYEEKMSLGKVGTAYTYYDARESIIAFGGKDLQITDIDQEWLIRYEADMLAKGRSLDTVGFYLRNLRAVFNKAIKRNIILRDDYPFGEGKYVIRKKRTKKKVPSVQAKNNIVAYTPQNESESLALDLSLFSYFCNGMNFTDIAYLKESNFHGNYFLFIRRKTKDTVKEQKEIKIPISDRIREILNRRAIHKPYIFGIITDEMSPTEQKLKIVNMIHLTNKWLKRIAVKVGYEGKISTYTLRHLFTKMLIDGGIPLTKVSGALGHLSILTTQNYTEDLDIETSNQFDNLL